ncbi:hypothetical protein LTS14_010163 [Recurvomyces mirabilis]|uniref:uncharacterized protein n=1 Tax=Recurvomyces mirabilis TaxID=574656 RepID=UPI002DE1CDB7|nr:hypothetical protein LTS14_010163 [Recurvomyces mirabilis]
MRSMLRLVALACLAQFPSVSVSVQLRQDSINVTSPAYPPSYCTNGNSSTKPYKFGYIIFSGYEPLDINGPVSALGTLGRDHHIELSVIAETMSPVTSAPLLPAMNPFNSTTFVTLSPTHTFETAPQDIEVLIIPGGAGSRSSKLNTTFAYLQQTYPKLQYLITVCTGALVASRAGLLDGKFATTNKQGWAAVVATNHHVHWVPQARWVVDGNIWSTSGVSAGIDGTLGFIECFYGTAVATAVAK